MFAICPDCNSTDIIKTISGNSACNDCTWISWICPKCNTEWEDDLADCPCADRDI